MSIVFDIQCDRCGRQSGKAFPRETTTSQARGMLAPLGWKPFWGPKLAKLQKPADFCPTCVPDAKGES